MYSSLVIERLPTGYQLYLNGQPIEGLVSFKIECTDPKVVRFISEIDVSLDGTLDQFPNCLDGDFSEGL